MRKHPPERIDAAIGAYLAGASQREIRDRIGVPIATLTKHMRQRGITLSEEQIRERQRQGGKIAGRKTQKCKPGCTCYKHKSPTNKKDFVVLGRKFCQGKCGRWRLLVDFHVRRRDKDGNPVEWQGLCKTCQKMSQRKSPYPRKSLTPEERRAYKRALHMRLRSDPEWAERNREYHRIYAEGRRRAQGIQPRFKQFENREVSDGTPLVDPGPFVEWFNSLNGSRPAMDDGLARRVWAVRNGETKRIHISVIDQVTVLAGQPEMTYILYPDV